MIFSWYISAIFSILFWGIADLFYKKGTDPKDKYSHLRIIIMVGLVMGIQAIFELNKMGWQLDRKSVV